MRLLKLTAAGAAVMVTMLVMVQGLAMARSFDFDDFDNDNGFFFDGNDFDNVFEQETDQTGDVTLDTSIVNTGDNSNQCVAPIQFGNTGNLQNAQGFSSLGSSSDNRFDNDGFFDFFDFNNDFDSNVDDVEFEGGSFEFAPEQAVECDQSVEQAAAASN